MADDNKSTGGGKGLDASSLLAAASILPTKNNTPAPASQEDATTTGNPAKGLSSESIFAAMDIVQGMPSGLGLGSSGRMPGVDLSEKGYNFQLRSGGTPFTNQDVRSQLQPTHQKIGHGALRLLGTTATKLIESVGFMGGFVDYLVNGDFSRVYDNDWVNMWAHAEESMKEALPVHKMQRTIEGDLIDKMSSLEWWMDDVIDGFAFLGSMMIPGAAYMKGLGGSYKLLSRLMSNATRMAKGGKVGKQTTKIGLTKYWAEQADLVTVSLFNTVNEAGFEAKDAQEEIRRALQPYVDAGRITQEEAEKRAAIGARNTFVNNTWILVPSNYITNSFLFKSFKSSKSSMKNLFDKEGNVIEKATRPLTFKQMAGIFGKNSVISMASEGLWEENAQLASTNMEKAIALQDPEFLNRTKLESMASEMVNNLYTDEGQEAIALGAIIGILPGGIGGVRQARAEQKGRSLMHAAIAAASTKYMNSKLDLYKRDKDGELVFNKKGHPQYSEVKLAKLIEQVASKIGRADAKAIFAASNSRTAYEKIQQLDFAEMALQFFAFPGGLEHLETMIDTIAKEEAQDLNRMADRDELGQEVSVEQIAANYKKLARQLARVYDDVINNSPISRAGKRYDPEFVKISQAAIFDQAQTQIFWNERLPKLKARLQQIKDGQGLPTDTEETVKRLEELIATGEESVKTTKELIKDFYSKKKLDKQYKIWQKVNASKEQVVQQVKNEQEQAEGEEVEETDPEADPSTVQQVKSRTGGKGTKGTKQKINEKKTVKNKKIQGTKQGVDTSGVPGVTTIQPGDPLYDEIMGTETAEEEVKRSVEKEITDEVTRELHEEMGLLDESELERPEKKQEAPKDQDDAPKPQIQRYVHPEQKKGEIKNLNPDETDTETIDPQPVTVDEMKEAEEMIEKIISDNLEERNVQVIVDALRKAGWVLYLNDQQALLEYLQYRIENAGGKKFGRWRKTAYGKKGTTPVQKAIRAALTNFSKLSNKVSKLEKEDRDHVEEERLLEARINLASAAFNLIRMTNMLRAEAEGIWSPDKIASLQERAVDALIALAEDAGIELKAINLLGEEYSDIMDVNIEQVKDIKATAKIPSAATGQPLEILEPGTSMVIDVISPEILVNGDQVRKASVIVGNVIDDEGGGETRIEDGKLVLGERDREASESLEGQVADEIADEVNPTDLENEAKASEEAEKAVDKIFEDETQDATEFKSEEQKEAERKSKTKKEEGIVNDDTDASLNTDPESEQETEYTYTDPTVRSTAAHVNFASFTDPNTGKTRTVAVFTPEGKLVSHSPDTSQGIEIELEWPLISNPNVQEVELLYFENDWWTRNKKKYKAEDQWKQAPIYLVWRDENGKAHIIDKLHAHSDNYSMPERQKIYEQLMKGNPVRMTLRKLTSNNNLFNETVLSDEGKRTAVLKSLSEALSQVYSLDGSGTLETNAPIVLAIGRAHPKSEEWIMDMPHHHELSPAVNRKIAREVAPAVTVKTSGQVHAVVMGPDGRARVIKLSTKFLNERAINEIFRNFAKEGNEGIAAIKEIVHTDSDTDLVTPTFLNIFTRGQSTYIRWARKDGTVASITLYQLKQALEGKKFTAYVMKQKDGTLVKGKQIPMDQIDPVQELMDFLETKKYNVDITRINSKGKYVSRVMSENEVGELEYKEYDSYNDYLMSGREDSKDAPGIVTTDMHNENGALWFNLTVEAESITYQEPITDREVLEEDTEEVLPKRAVITTREKKATPEKTTPEEAETINVYAGTNENAHLSNFAERPFRYDFDPNHTDIKFRTVEGAFQAMKLLHSKKYTYGFPPQVNEEGRAILKKLQNATGREAKRIGRGIKGLDVKQWDKDSYSIMIDLIRASFKANSEARQALLDTGDATITHTQDKGPWGTKFPKALMKVRDELRAELEERESTKVDEKDIGPQDEDGAIELEVNSIEDLIEQDKENGRPVEKALIERLSPDDPGVSISEAVEKAGMKLLRPREMRMVVSDPNEAPFWNELISRYGWGTITHISFNKGESRFIWNTGFEGKEDTEDLEFMAQYSDGRWELYERAVNVPGSSFKHVSIEEMKKINQILRFYSSGERQEAARRGTGIKELLYKIHLDELVRDIEAFENKEYTEEEKKALIIPLENSVQKLQAELQEKWGNSYTIQDFIDSYYEELRIEEAARAFDEKMNQDGDIDWANFGGTVLRQRPVSENYERADLEKAQAWLKKRLPEVSVSLFKKAVEIADSGGMVAHGYFKNGAIHLWESMEVGTEYHEAFHVVSTIYLTDEQKAQILEEAKGRYKPVTKQWRDQKAKQFLNKEQYEQYKKDGTLPKDVEVAIEWKWYNEEMAEDFRDYTIEQEEVKGYRRIFKFFKDLWNYIKTYLTHKRTIDQLFSNLESGRINKRFAADVSKYDDDTMHRIRPGRKWDAQDQREVIDHATAMAVKIIEKRQEKGRSVSPLHVLEEVQQRFLQLAFVRLHPKEGGGFEARHVSLNDAIAYFQDPAQIPNDVVRHPKMELFRDVYENWEDTVEKGTNNILYPGWRDSIKMSLRNVGYKVMEESEIIETDDTYEKIYSRSHFLDSAKDRLSGATKKFLKTKVVYIDKEGNPILNSMKTASPVPFDQLYKDLIYTLMNVQSLPSMLAALTTKASYNDRIRSFLHAFEGLNDQGKASLYRDLRMNYQNFLTVLEEFSALGDGQWSLSMKLIDTSDKKMDDKILNRWKNNAIDRTGERPSTLYEVVYDKEHGIKFKRVREGKAEEAEVLWKRIKKAERNKITAQTKKDTIQLLNLLGIDMPIDTLNLYLKEGIWVEGENITGDDLFRELIYTSTSSGAKNYSLGAIVGSLKSSPEGDIFTSFTKLLKRFTAVEKKFASDLELSFMNSQNQSVYPINMPSLISNIANAIKSNTLSNIVDHEQDPLFKPLQGTDYFDDPLLRAFKEIPAVRENFKLEDLDAWKEKNEQTASNLYENMDESRTRILRYVLYMNNNNESFMKIVSPILADRRRMLIMTVPRIKANLHGWGSIVDNESHVLIKMIVQDIMAIKKAKREVLPVEQGGLPDNQLVEGLHYDPKVGIVRWRPGENDNELKGGAFQFHQVPIDNIELNDPVFEDDTLQDLDFENLHSLHPTLTKILRDLRDLVDERAEEQANLLYASTVGTNQKSAITLFPPGWRARFAPEARDEREALKELARSYILDNWMAKASFFKLTGVHRGLYKNEEDVVKRYGGLASPGYEMLERGWISDVYGADPNLRVTWVRDLVDKTQEYADHLRQVFKNEEDTGWIDAWDEINGTDSFGVTSIHETRSNMMGMGVWDMATHEKAYQNYINAPEGSKIFGYEETITLKDGSKKTVLRRPVLQPAKTYYDGHHLVNGSVRRVMIKHATMPLLEEFTKNYPVFDAMRKRMEDPGDLPPLDAINSEGAGKFGMWGIGSVEDLENLTVIVLDRKNQRVPQMIPEHKNKSPKENVQIRKNILDNLQMDGTYRLSDGTEMTGQELYDLYHAAQSERVRKSLDALYEKLSYEPEAKTDKLTFLKRFRKTLLEEIEERELPGNYERALDLVFNAVSKEHEFGTPLAFPAFYRRFESIIFSLFKRNVLVQRMNGKGTVQVAEFGTHGKRGALKFIRNEDGTIKHAEVAISYSLAHAMGIKPGDDLSKMPDELRTMIGYRIPNQGKNSILPMKVVDIFPDGTGEVILVPKNITVQMGSDFDVDKIWLMMPNYQTQGLEDYVKDHVEKATGERFNLTAEVKDMIRSLQNSTERSPEYGTDEWLITQAIEAFEQEYANKTLKVEKVKFDPKKSVRDQSRAALENGIIDMMEAIMLSPMHFEEVVQPLDASELDISLAQAFRKNPDLARELDYSDPETEIIMEMRNKIGNAGVGIYANFLSGAAIRQFANITLNPDYAPIINYGGQDHIFTDLSSAENDTRIPNKRKLVSQSISERLSSAMDNAKTPKMYYLNDNPVTQPVIGLFNSLRMGNQVVNLILNQPIIREFVKRYTEAGGVPSRFRSIAEKLGQEWVEGFSLSDYQKTTPISYAALEDQAWDTDYTRRRDIQVDILANFVLFHRAGTELMAANKVISTDNVSDMSSIAAVEEFMDRTALFTGENDIIRGIDEILSGEKYPMSKAFREYALEASRKFALQFFPFAPNEARGETENAISSLKQDIKTGLNKRFLNKDEHQMLHNMVFMSLFARKDSPFARIFTESMLKTTILTDAGVPAHLNSLFLKYPDLRNNFFLSHIEPARTNAFADSNTSLIRLQYDLNPSAEESDLMTADLQRLFEDERDDVRAFAKELVAYSLLHTGFAKTYGSFIDLIPIEVWDGRLEAEDKETMVSYFRKILPSLNDPTFLEDIIDDVIRNSVYFPGFVPTVVGKKPKKGAMVFQPHDSKIWSSDTKSHLMYFRRFNKDKKGWELYKRQRQTSKSVVYRQIEVKGKPNHFFEMMLRDEKGNQIEGSLNPDNQLATPEPPIDDSTKTTVQGPVNSETIEVEAGAAPQVTIQMQSANVEKILQGEKTTTVRSESQKEKIGLEIGESAQVMFKGKPFTITLRGLMSIEEAGGKDAVWESEGFDEKGPKYSNVKAWLDGKGKLYIYDITPAEESTEETVYAKEAHGPEFTETALRNIVAKLEERFGITANIITDKTKFWAGKFEQGVPTINLAYARGDTPFHEFAHPFIDLLERDNKPLFDKLTQDILREKKLIQYVKKRYPELSGINLIKEAMATLIGIKASKRVSDTEGAPMVDDVYRVQAKLGDYFHMLWRKSYKITPAKLWQHTTLDDLADYIAIGNVQLDSLVNTNQVWQSKTEESTTREERYKDLVNKMMVSLETQISKIEKRTVDGVESRAQINRLRRLQDAIKDIDDMEALRKFVEEAYYRSYEIGSRLQNALTNKDESRDSKIVAIYDALAFMEDYKMLKDIAEEWNIKYLGKTIDEANDVLSQVDEKKPAGIRAKLDYTINISGAVNVVVDQLGLPLIAEFLLEADTGGVTEAAEEVGRADLKITKQILIDELRRASKDITAWSALLDPAISVNDLVVSLFAKRLKMELEKARLLDIQLQEEFDAAYKAYKEASGVDPDDVEKFNAPIIERTTQLFYDVEEEKNVEHDVWQMVEKFDSARFAAARREMMKETGKIEDPAKRNAARARWFVKNTKPRTKKEQLRIISEHKYVYGDDVEGFERWKSEQYDANEKPIRDLAQPSDEYLNPKWHTLYNENDKPKNAAGRYHQALFNLYMRAQEKIPEAQRPEHILPSIRKEGVDRIREQGLLRTVKDVTRETFIRVSTDTEYGVVTSPSGETSPTLPIFYVNRIDANDVSLNVLESIMQFSSMANQYEARNRIYEHVQLLNNIVGKRKITETDAKGNVVINTLAKRLGITLPQDKDPAGPRHSTQRLKDFLEMVYYGRMQQQEKELYGVALDKLVNALNLGTSILALSGNFLQGVNNVILGETLIFAEAAGGRWYSREDYIKGKKIYWSHLNEVLGDIGKIKKDGKLTQVIELFDAIQGEFLTTYGKKVTGSMAKKLFETSTLFFIQHAGEHTMQVSTLLALMNATKVKDSKGNEMSLWDAYEQDNQGRLVLKKGVKFSETDRLALMNRLHGINKRLHGVYNNFDKAAWQKTSIGRLAMLFRNWIRPGMVRRWGGMKREVEIDDIVEGNYVTFGRFLMKQLREYKTDLAANWGSMNDVEKANVRKTLAEIVSLIVAMTVFGLMGSVLDDEEKKKRVVYGAVRAEQWLVNFIAYQARRLQSELLFFTLPHEAWKILRTPTATMGTIDRITGLLGQLIYGPFEEYERKTGIHKKGDSKLWAKFTRLLPVIGSLERTLTPEQSLKWFMTKSPINTK